MSLVSKTRIEHMFSFCKMAYLTKNESIFLFSTFLIGVNREYYGTAYMIYPLNSHWNITVNRLLMLCDHAADRRQKIKGVCTYEEGADKRIYLWDVSYGSGDGIDWGSSSDGGAENSEPSVHGY
ncbi:hypothetical protein KL86CLO1_11672 [uncultured Eubacteriales bacterium]|uniref:Uncharacterized protein n=1 Tax=uncultured Eubacteriales bacterium TaxID=172733 RepID=A0A212JT25_9FIRM|nr:hypothetical protein KL86CLO1_11672 [uncultured Eubacteriales bacterium]